MDETLTSVNAEQASDEGLHTEVETVTGASETVAPAEQQTEPTSTAADTVSVEKPKQTAEENARFAAIRREAAAAAEAKARDAMIAEIYGEQGIKTYAEYQAAVAEQRRQQELEQLTQQNIPREYAEKLMKVDELEARFREQEAAKAEQERRDAEFNDFAAYFKKVHNRDFQEADVASIPPEVFQTSSANKIPLRFAYAEYIAEQANNKLLGIDTGKKTAEVNSANATTTTGGVTGNGQADNGVLTEEIIAGMSDKQRMSRWDDIKKFYKMK